MTPEFNRYLLTYCAFLTGYGLGHLTLRPSLILAMLTTMTGAATLQLLHTTGVSQ